MSSPIRISPVLLVHTKLEVTGRIAAWKIATLRVARSSHCRLWHRQLRVVGRSGRYQTHPRSAKNVHLIMACSSGFSRRSVGYVGFSDGWQDVMHHFKMDWQFESAENGNIALTGEINLPATGEFTLADSIWPQLPEQRLPSCSNPWLSPSSSIVWRMSGSGSARS